MAEEETIAGLKNPQVGSIRDRIVKGFEGIPPRWDFQRDGFEGVVLGFAREES